MFKFDLKQAYHHVDIFADHRKYLSFAWNFGNCSIRYFQFCVLPFGLSTAPFVFTKLLKPLTKSWRMQGIPILIFLDDGLGAGKSNCQAKIWSLVAHSDLLKCGFCINESKRQWEPIQGIVWLGYVIDTIAQSPPRSTTEIVTPRKRLLKSRLKLVSEKRRKEKRVYVGKLKALRKELAFYQTYQR